MRSSSGPAASYGKALRHSRPQCRRRRSLLPDNLRGRVRSLGSSQPLGNLDAHDTALIFTEHFQTERPDRGSSPTSGTCGAEAARLPRTTSELATRFCGPHRSTLLFAPWNVPYSGLMDVIELLAKQDIPPDLPLVLDVNITVVSATPADPALHQLRQEIG